MTFACVPAIDTPTVCNILHKFAVEKKFLDEPAERQSRSKLHASIHEFPHIGGFGMDVKSPFDVQPQIMKRLNESSMRNERGGPDNFTDMDDETASVIKQLDAFARHKISSSGVFPQIKNFDLGYVQFIRVDANGEIKKHFDTNPYGDIVAVYAVCGKGLVGIQNCEEFLVEEGQMYIFDSRFSHWVDCKQFEETRMTVTLRYYETKDIDETKELNNKFLTDGYVTWDLELSTADMKNMSDFCSTFTGGDHRDLIDGRKNVSVPLEELPPCCRSVFTRKLFDALSHYFGYLPGLIEAIIIKVPPTSQNQTTHSVCNIGYGLRAILSIQFDNYLTTCLVPGSHTPGRRKELDCTDLTDRVKVDPLLKQPCMEDSKNAMLYDSSIILNSVWHNDTTEWVSPQICFTFGAILPLQLMIQTTAKYHEPQDPMINKMVLDIINKDMVQTSRCFDFEAFHQGRIVSFDVFDEYQKLQVAKRVILKEIFLNKKQTDIDICAHYVMSVFRGDYVTTKRNTPLQVTEQEVEDLCKQWKDSEILNFAEKIKNAYISVLHSKTEIVFQGKDEMKEELLVILDDFYSSFEQHCIANIDENVVLLVKDALYNMFSAMKINQGKMKQNLSEKKSKFETEVARIHETGIYDRVSPDFHILWADDDIRDYIGSIVFSFRQPEGRFELLSELYREFSDQTVPDIKRLLYQTFSSLHDRFLRKNETCREILKKTISLINSDKLLYENVIIPEELKFLWKSKPILEKVFAFADSLKEKSAKTIRTVEIGEEFSDTIQNYFEVYLSYSSVPYMQEFLFKHFKMIKSKKNLTKEVVKQIIDDFKTIRSGCENIIKSRVDIPDSLCDSWKPGLFFVIAHTLDESKHMGTFKTLFSSFKIWSESVLDDLNFITKLKKSSEKLIDMTKQTLAVIEGSDNIQYIIKELSKLQKAAVQEEEEIGFTTLVEELEMQSGQTKNKEV